MDKLSRCGSVPPKPPPFALPFTTTQEAEARAGKIFRAPLPWNDVQVDEIDRGEGGATSVNHEA